MELSTVAGQVASPCQNLHGGVLVDRVTLTRRQRNHVALCVGAILQVLGVQEVHRLGGDTGRGHADTTVENHVGIHVLHGHEAKLGVGVGSETLDVLQAGSEVAPVGVVHHDQIGTVLTADQAGPHRVHHCLNVGSGGRRTVEGGGVERLVLPERPGATVDAAIGVGVHRWDSSLQAGDLLAAGAGAVRVDAGGDQVRHGRLRRRTCGLRAGR